ncbi:hypothetical protein QJS10_CPB20g01797 [Acorus calamus]|uniref:YTH domain-containing family protein n=1 Tax=Acorus calamus TaxID=4465 RepID=A0AAV9CEL5_ACOCL|nr:hypothetical protein QJS10_CPB20g01797 [Acorus calamus]
METKPVDDMMKNLKIDPSTKPENLNVGAPRDDGSPSDATSCISSAGDPSSSVKGSDVDQESLAAEQAVYYPYNSYYGYYYPGYDGSFGEMGDAGYYVGADGVEVPHPVIQADNGSLVYYIPDFPPGYNPYSPYLSGAMVGADGQYVAQQAFIPSPVFQQPPLMSPGYFTPSVAYGSEFVPVYPWDQSFIVDGSYGNGYSGVLPVPIPKPNASAPSHAFIPSKPKQLSKPTKPSETKGTSAAVDVFPSPGGQNQKPGNKGKGGLVYPTGPFNVKDSGRLWVSSEKSKARSKANALRDFDLYEQNHGPRTNSTKSSCVDPAESLDAEGNEKSSTPAVVICRDDYNLPDFPTKYDHAMFFVIKSYSEDDIHKSIKYNVWASTPNGNKRLDAAYQAAQGKIGEMGGKCPVFLFFSVNASGQFCGIAEMIGRVDFSKSMDFWQQDKWNGFFPVKWHIIKDVPNQQFRHIILENNDNKPVTNSRDTQEVKFLQGAEMLNVFKKYSSKTSILDDFGFYENRQKALQEKKIRPFAPRVEYFPPKLVEDDLPSTKSSDQKTIVASAPQVIESASKTEKLQEVSEAK